MNTNGTLLLTRDDVAELLSLDECITAVESAFRMQGVGKAERPGILGMHANGGGFHIKASLLELSMPYFAAKLNANFCENTARYGLPNIQGVVVLCRGDNGYPLAVMDSIEITILRTGAATAVAARHLARRDSEIATVCGCGNQGRIQLLALTRVLPIKRVYAVDLSQDRSERFSREMATRLGIEIIPTQDPGAALAESDVCVTCTPSKKFFLCREAVRPGTFVAAVGADSADKQELEPALLASAKVVVDILEQCATIGELHHALAAGVITQDQVHGELGEIVAGQKAGRTSKDEIVVFDSTGTALQDVAAAAVVYEKALAANRGLRVDFAA